MAEAGVVVSVGEYIVFECCVGEAGRCGGGAFCICCEFLSSSSCNRLASS